MGGNTSKKLTLWQTLWLGMTLKSYPPSYWKADKQQGHSHGRQDSRMPANKKFTVTSPGDTNYCITDGVNNSNLTRHQHTDNFPAINHVPYSWVWWSQLLESPCSDVLQTVMRHASGTTDKWESELMTSNCTRINSHLVPHFTKESNNRSSHFTYFISTRRLLLLFSNLLWTVAMLSITQLWLTLQYPHLTSMQSLWTDAGYR